MTEFGIILSSLLDKWMNHQIQWPIINGLSYLDVKEKENYDIFDWYQGKKKEKPNLSAMLWCHYGGLPLTGKNCLFFFQQSEHGLNMFVEEHWKLNAGSRRLFS